MFKEIIQKIHDFVRQAEMYSVMKKMKYIQLFKEFESQKINDTLNHINMNTHNLNHIIMILELDFNNSALFSDLYSSFILLKHQMMIISTMSEQKQSADKYVADKILTFQIRILTNDMNLKKLLQYSNLYILFSNLMFRFLILKLHSMNQLLFASYQSLL